MLRGYKTEMLVAGSVVFAAAGQILIKLGLLSSGRFSHVVAQWILPVTAGVALGLLIYGLGTILWFAAVSRGNISYVYPLAATNYVLLGIAGRLVLHESISPVRWTGIGVMAIGIALLSIDGRKVARP